MKIIPLLKKEFDQETEITRHFIDRVPDDKFDWRPHEKSMPIKQLAIHIAELPAWVEMAFNTSNLNFAENEYEPAPIADTKELVALLDESITKGKNALNEADEDNLKPEWTLRNGDQVLAEWNKYEVIRHALNQITHHRAQLGVYFRLLDIPVPSSYGPSADDQSFG